MANFYCSMYHLMLLVSVLAADLLLADWIPRLSRPPVYGSMLSKRDLSPRFRKVRAEILNQHNFYRSMVDPPAQNMQEMSWHRWAARTAQKWAQKCLMLVHTTLEGLVDPVMGQCGQNIFIASTQVPWSFAVRVWDVEKFNFSYGGIRNNSIGVNGHYTQLVWATSNKVGCGYSPCKMTFKNETKTFHNYVCNYCPIGNDPASRDFPYKSGKSCSSCPAACRGGRLCSPTPGSLPTISTASSMIKPSNETGSSR